MGRSRSLGCQKTDIGNDRDGWVLSRGGDVTRWAVDVICGAPIPAPGKAWLTRYRQRALTVVSLVREPQLKKVRQDCLGALERIDLSMPDGFYE